MSEEHQQERVHTEPAVLDIGGDIGALIIYTAPELRSREIEISPVADLPHRSHNVVHERRMLGRSVFAAVFPELTAGDYRLWGLDGRADAQIAIRGGEVSEVDWR